MKKKILLLIMFYMSLQSILFAQSNGFGIGVKLGEPTGLNAKYWISESNAFSFSLGYSLISDRKLYLNVDYLFHQYDVLHIRSSSREEIVPLFYGFGARFITREHDEGSFGARGVIGAAWFLNELPVDIFIEVAPIFKLFPSTGIDIEAGIGGRYFF